MKPEKFNGHASFETFLVQFENCAKYCEWPAKDKAAHLRWALTGTAAQLLWGAEDLSYELLLERLKRRFSGKGMEQKFQSELRCRRRNRGESLRELAQEIRRLMSMAYPGEKSSLSEHILRDSFLTSLGDTELELKSGNESLQIWMKPLELLSDLRCLKMQLSRSQLGAKGLIVKWLVVI